MDRCTLHRVYRVLFPNGKSYVGQTRRMPHERLVEHSKGYGNTLMHRALTKYGMENVKLQTLLVVSHDDVDIAERVFIAAYDSLVPSGYNIAGGGRGVMNAPTLDDYARLRCAFWSARIADAYEPWKQGCNLPDDLASYVYEYAKRSSPLGYSDRPIF